MRFALLVTSALLTLLAAGCSSPAALPAASAPSTTGAGPFGSAPSGAPATSAYPATPAAPVVTSQPIRWTAASATPQTGPAGTSTNYIDAQNTMDVVIPPGAVRVTVAANWTCALPSCPMDIDAGPQGQATALATGSGDGMATFTLDRFHPGPWTVWAQPQGASANMKGTLSVTVAFA